MNIPIVNIYGFDGDGTATAKQNKLNYVLQLGTLSSALEHAVPEQMFVTPENPGEAISAVKALSKASAAGQRIYHINQQNQSAILPFINHDSLVMNEIRNALAVGKEVITHTDAVSVPGWSGAGYIVYDPASGDGAYKIGGGANGSHSLMGAYGGAMVQTLAAFVNIMNKVTPGLVSGPVGFVVFLSLAMMTFTLAVIGVLTDAKFQVATFEEMNAYVTITALGILTIPWMKALAPIIAAFVMTLMVANRLMEPVIRK